MKRTSQILLVLVLLFSGAWSANAVGITYTEQATASGTLGTNSFTSELVTITFTGDTTNVINQGGGFYSNMVGTTTLSISGIGTATFTDSMQAFDNQTFVPPAAGIGDLTQGGSVLDTFSAVFATYDLMTSIGPITGDSFIRPDLTFATTLGGFNLTFAGLSTFTATTAPEPATMLLLGSGLLGLVGLRRKFSK